MTNTNDAINSVTPTQAWEALRTQPHSALIDVRSAPEWNFVGIPNLHTIQKKPILIEWQDWHGNPNQAFLTELDKALRENGIDQPAHLFFLCRSGVRSQAAAQTVAQHTNHHCANIASGFEGNKNQHNQRGKTDGWRHDGLPWMQS